MIKVIIDLIVNHWEVFVSCHNSINVYGSPTDVYILGSNKSSYEASLKENQVTETDKNLPCVLLLKPPPDIVIFGENCFSSNIFLILKAWESQLPFDQFLKTLALQVSSSPTHLRPLPGHCRHTTAIACGETGADHQHQHRSHRLGWVSTLQNRHWHFQNCPLWICCWYSCGSMVRHAHIYYNAFLEKDPFGCFTVWSCSRKHWEVSCQFDNISGQVWETEASISVPAHPQSHNNKISDT